jgi:hypothetical protein
MTASGEMTALARTREFEVARSWRKHEPLRAAVPFAAKQRARSLIDTVARERKISEVPSKVLHPLLQDWFHSKKLSLKQRALQKLQRLLAPAHLHHYHGALVIRSLWAYGSNIKDGHPRYSQNALSVISSLMTEADAASVLTLEAPLHALARLFERGNVTPTEVRAAVVEAVDHFLAASREEMKRVALIGENVSLPAGQGLFLGHVIEATVPDAAPGTMRIFFRARTWIPLSDALADQVPPPSAQPPTASMLYFYAMKSDVGLA